MILGIDYGEKRIGIAVSDDTETLAVPSETLEPVSRDQLVDEIIRISAEKGVRTIVVGMPLSLSGAASAQTAVTQDFVAALKKRLEIPVEVQDERLTSVEADRGGVDAATRDARAAAIMLQSYLDRQRAERS